MWDYIMAEELSLENRKQGVLGVKMLEPRV